MFRLVFLLMVLIRQCSGEEDRLMVQSDADSHSDEYVDHINKLNSTWKAERQFVNYTEDELRLMLGDIGFDEDKSPELSELLHDAHENVVIPETFDARTQWPFCKTVGQIRYQGKCGSCWAFGAVESFSDRFCIATNGSVNVELSPQDLLTCCGDCGHGCRGGNTEKAWIYFANHGVVSGGLYGTHNTCQPYQFCDHSKFGRNCTDPTNTDANGTPHCVVGCDFQFDRIYFDDKYFASKVYKVGSDERQIQLEILQNGPVEVSIRIYKDFLHYKKGVYQRHTDEGVGGHAMRLLGWGVDNGTKYWLVANSWGEHWGESGYVRIRRGVNECHIEERVFAGIPKI